MATKGEENVEYIGENNVLISKTYGREIGWN
jgi:hypothetical protein